jgi:hypothetical protein
MVQGPIRGWRRTIDRIALVGRSDPGRGPCRQVYAHRLLSVRNCEVGDECPCQDARQCQVPAIVELDPDTPIDVLIVPDENPTLQDLRTEFRPETAELDGILGTAALRALSIDVDNPHDRLLLRCETGNCRVRPALTTTVVRPVVVQCLERAEALDIDAGVPDAASVDAGL